MKYLQFILTIVMLSQMMQSTYSQPIASGENETQESILSPDERRLFDLVNALRKDRNIKPFKFSKELYLKAKSISTELSEKGVMQKGFGDSQSGGEESGAIWFKSILSSGTNYIEETVASIRANFAFYRSVIDPDFKEAGIAIVQGQKTGLYYVSQILSKKRENSDAFYLEELEFDRLIKILEQITFGLERNVILREYDEFIHTPGSIYPSSISANSVTVYYRDVHPPFSYVQFTFSNISDIFTGVHTKAYFFKERTYQKEKERLDAIYDSPEKKNNDPYYFKRLDEKLKLCYWITKDEIVELRWMSREGVYVTITKSLFGFRYANFFKERFHLKESISERVYFQLLKEFLKRSSHLEVSDFLKKCQFTFYGVEKEIKVEMILEGQKVFEIKSYYNQKGQVIRDDSYRANKKICSWNYIYDDKEVLSQIEIVYFNDEEENRTIDLSKPEKENSGVATNEE